MEDQGNLIYLLCKVANSKFLMPFFSKLGEGFVIDQGDNSSSTLTSNESGKGLNDDPFILPDYVCCVVTEGVWTVFFAVLLSIILTLVATLKYCKKRLSHPRFLQENQQLLIRYVMEDEKGAVSKIRNYEIPVQEFHKYYNKRREFSFIDRLEFTKVIQSATKHPVHAARDRRNLSKNHCQVDDVFSSKSDLI